MDLAERLSPMVFPIVVHSPTPQTFWVELTDFRQGQPRPIATAHHRQPTVYLCKKPALSDGLCSHAATVGRAAGEHADVYPSKSTRQLAAQSLHFGYAPPRSSRGYSRSVGVIVLGHDVNLYWQRGLGVDRHIVEHAALISAELIANRYVVVHAVREECVRFSEVERKYVLVPVSLRAKIHIVPKLDLSQGRSGGGLAEGLTDSVPRIELVRLLQDRHGDIVQAQRRWARVGREQRLQEVASTKLVVLRAHCSALGA
mmetsp:Transcript_99529/g.280839  ORF Transcript_99529/g.280839 Transcript_99529/m.280839 type:complete len:257 (+) Transcript_99529:427-1197(+)